MDPAARWAMLLLALPCAAAAQEFPLSPEYSAELRMILSGPERAQIQSMGARQWIPQVSLSRSVPDVSRFAVRGMDISHREDSQRAIDWPRAKAAGISFVFIKATEGGDWVDEDFRKHWNGAKTVGIYRGAYHFYNFCKTGKEQAANFMKVVPVETDMLPPTIDLEVSPSCSTEPSRKTFRKQLRDFMTAISKHYGKVPIIYVNTSIYNDYFAGEHDPYLIWFTEPFKEPAPSDGQPWAFWQYDYYGRVDGVGMDVDLDVFRGDLGGLAYLAR